eukprot:2873055-Rhodomonas_salina.1
MKGHSTICVKMLHPKHKQPQRNLRAVVPTNIDLQEDPPRQFWGGSRAALFLIFGIYAPACDSDQHAKEQAHLGSSSASLLQAHGEANYNTGI